MSRMYRVGTVRRTNWELIFLAVNAMWVVLALVVMVTFHTHWAAVRQDEKERIERQEKLGAAALEKLGAAALLEKLGAEALTMPQRPW